MKPLVLFASYFVLVTLSAQERRDDASVPSEISIRAQLHGFDAGSLSLGELFQKPTRTWCEAVKAYYEAGTNEITTKMKLPAARCYAFLNRPEDAAKVASEYTRAYPKDFRGWRVLGASKFEIKSYKEAVEALTTAARLGDDQNYTALGAAAIATEQYNVLRDIVVPHLLALKDRSVFSERERIEMRCILVACAGKLDKEEIFLDTLRNVNPSDIASSSELLSLVNQCWEQFHSSESREIRRKIEQAIQKIDTQSNGTNGLAAKQPQPQGGSKTHYEK